MQLEAVSRGSELYLSQRGQVRGRRLRFIPVPTPRWPDLLAVHSEEGEQGGERHGQVRATRVRMAVQD